MPTITVKNIPQEIYEWLKHSADINHRSLNSQIITYLEQGVQRRKMDPEALLLRARALRYSTRENPIPHQKFTAAKRAGRP